MIPALQIHALSEAQFYIVVTRALSVANTAENPATTSVGASQDSKKVSFLRRRRRPNLSRQKTKVHTGARKGEKRGPV